MHDINLLRPQIEQEKELAKSRGRFGFYITFAVILLLIITAAIFGTKFYLSSQARTLDAQISSLERDVSEVRSTEDKINNFNNTITQLQNLNKNKFIWSTIYDNIAKNTPADVKLTQVALVSTTSSKSTSTTTQTQTSSTTAGQKLKITGEAKSRRAIALFQYKLQKAGGNFVTVDIISSQKTEGDPTKNQLGKIDFEINVTLKTT